MSACASECDCGWPGPDYGPCHEPDCHWWDHCDEDRMCDTHRAEAMADHAYLRGSDPRFVFAADAQPASEFEFNQELRNAGRAHLIRE